MRDLIDNIDIDDVMMDEGIITVIWKKGFNNVKYDYDYAIDRLILHPVFDQVITLNKILELFPTVTIVIHESIRSGSIYRYDNHYDGEWERVGKTIGFA